MYLWQPWTSFEETAERNRQVWEKFLLHLRKHFWKQKILAKKVIPKYAPFDIKIAILIFDNPQRKFRPNFRNCLAQQTFNYFVKKILGVLPWKNRLQFGPLALIFQQKIQSFCYFLINF